MLVHILTVGLVISVCSTASAQHHRGSGGFYSTQLWLRQFNAMNAEQKKSSIAEADELIRQSDAKIKDLEVQQKKMASDLDAADRNVKSCDNSIKKCEAELRETRYQRSHLEKQLLADQGEQSAYRAALNALREAEEGSLKRAEQVLKRPMKDGNPEKLRISLKKQEYKSLEEDSKWVEEFRRFEKAKKQKTAEIDRLVGGDKSILNLDQSIGRLDDDRKTLKTDLSKAKSEKAILASSLQDVNANLEALTNNRDSAKVFRARVSGK